MWTSTMDLSPRRVLLTRFLGQFWPGAYFSSFAPLQVQNLPRQTLPAQAHDWIRVRNRLAGISSSDLHSIYSDGDFRIAPAALPDHTGIYPGQEVVGEIIEVGEDVQHVRVGDRVVLQYGPNCVSQGVQPLCRACAAGQYNLCEQRTFSGPQQIGGGWSEEILLHESQVFRVPDELSDDQAVMIEPSAVALHAVLRHLPQPGENVLIVGAGTIGLLVLQIVRALVPQAKVSVLAHYAFQVEQATRMGAEHIIYPQDTYKGVQQATGAKLYKGKLGNTMLLGGYDVIYDTIGTKRTLHDALRWTRAGGAVVIVGVSLHMMRIDLSPVWYQEVSLIGSMNHGTEQWPVGSQEHFSTFAISAELIGQGLIHPEKLITHRFALTNFPEALSTASGKEHTRAIKVIFDYALMPASVVPNVRSSARLRRPVRLRATTADAQEAQEQQDQQLEPPAQQEPAREEPDWESMGIPAISGTYDISEMPTGGTWSQNVQPYPSPTLPAENGSESAHEPEESIPQHLRALTGAVESPTHEYVEYEPAEAPVPPTVSDDPLTMEFDLPSSPPEEPATPATSPGEQPAMDFEQPLAMTEEPTVTFSRQREPQPILLPISAQPVPEPELEHAEAAQVDEPPPAPSTRMGRTRVKPSTRKTTGSSSATNQAPDTL